jgi:hypothetical protein
MRKRPWHFMVHEALEEIRKPSIFPQHIGRRGFNRWETSLRRPRALAYYALDGRAVWSGDRSTGLVSVLLVIAQPVVLNTPDLGLDIARNHRPRWAKCWRACNFSYCRIVLGTRRE